MKVKIKRNSVGAVEIHDAQIKARWDTSEVVKPLEGITRLAILKRKNGDISIDWKNNTGDKFLRFASDEEAEFSTWVEVPKGKVIVIEFVMVSCLPFRLGEAQVPNPYAEIVTADRSTPFKCVSA